MLKHVSGKVFVTGASSIVGSVLIPLLEQNDLQTVILGRKPVAQSAHCSWHFLDMAVRSESLPPVEGSVLIHTASLWLLSGWLEKFKDRGVRRVIAFSSTSRFTKNASASIYELEVVNKLIAAEDYLAAECQRLNIEWTVFRPTLIYGGTGSDRNVSDIARFIRRFGFFPLFGGGKGRRQPVQARDLATACVQSLGVTTSCNKAYNLSGGETLAYADMVRRIFKALERRPVFLPVPIAIFRVVVGLARLLPRYKHLTADMALRMQVDLVFDHDEASKDFGYCPGEFDPSYLKQIRPK